MKRQLVERELTPEGPRRLKAGLEGRGGRQAQPHRDREPRRKPARLVAPRAGIWMIGCSMRARPCAPITNAPSLPPA